MLQQFEEQICRRLGWTISVMYRNAIHPDQLKMSKLCLKLRVYVQSRNHTRLLLFHLNLHCWQELCVLSEVFLIMLKHDSD